MEAHPSTKSTIVSTKPPKKPKKTAVIDPPIIDPESPIEDASEFSMRVQQIDSSPSLKHAKKAPHSIAPLSKQISALSNDISARIAAAHRSKATPGKPKPVPLPTKRPAPEQSTIIAVDSDEDLPVASSSKITPPSKAKTVPKVEIGSGKGKKAPTAKSKKPQRIQETAFEAAERLNAEWADKKLATRALKNAVIFYYGQDGKDRIVSASSLKRMEFILRNGGRLAPTFDTSVMTHCVSEGKNARQFCEYAGICDVVKDIPAEIPTVEWKWVGECVENGCLAKPYHHEAFMQRIQDREKEKSYKGKGKAKAVELPSISTEGPSHVS